MHFFSVSTEEWITLSCEQGGEYTGRCVQVPQVDEEAGCLYGRTTPSSFEQKKVLKAKCGVVALTLATVLTFKFS